MRAEWRYLDIQGLKKLPSFESPPKGVKIGLPCRRNTLERNISFKNLRLNILPSLKSSHTEIWPSCSYNKFIWHSLLQNTCTFWSLFRKLPIPRYLHDLPLQLSQVLFKHSLILKVFPNHLHLYSDPALICSLFNPLSYLIDFRISTWYQIQYINACL